MPANDTPRRISIKADPDDPATRTSRPSLRGSDPATMIQDKPKRKQAKKSAEPYDKAARPVTTTKNGTRSTTVAIPSTQNVKVKAQAPDTKKNKIVTGKENRTTQSSGTRKRTKAKQKVEPPVSETIPSSDTLVAPSSPGKIKVEEEPHICTIGDKNGAYTRSADVPCPSSPLPPSSPPPPISSADIPLSAFVPIRKSRRLLGLRASPAPRDAPPELKTELRSRASSVSSTGDYGRGGAGDYGQQSGDAASGGFDGDGHDSDKSNGPRSDRQVLRLPDDMIRDDGYAEREEWFDRKKAEYARPWDAPTDVCGQTDSSIATTARPALVGSWTPTISFLPSIAYSRSPCTTLSALFWAHESNKEETEARSPCTECVDHGAADAHDCEGGGIPGRRPAFKHIRADSGKGMDVEIGLEDAPWCINGARMRYDGSVVGVCLVCTVSGASELGTLGDSGHRGDGLLRRVD